MEKIMAQALIEIKAVKFSPLKPFKYASGLWGPIYCDNRMLLSHVKFRNLMIESFIEIIKSNNLNYDLIGGIATAGIPSAAIIADRLEAPMIYVRPKPKGHGKMNQVEGDCKPFQKVLLLEDLVNQGSSLEDAINGTKNSKLIVSDCLCIVDYQMPEAKGRLNKLGINLYSVTNFSVLVNCAFELKLINEAEKNELQSWNSDPVSWSKRFT